MFAYTLHVIAHESRQMWRQRRNQQQVKGPHASSPQTWTWFLLCLTLQLSVVNITVSVFPRDIISPQADWHTADCPASGQLLYLCPLPLHLLLSAEMHHSLLILSCTHMYLQQVTAAVILPRKSMASCGGRSAGFGGKQHALFLFVFLTFVLCSIQS